MEILARVLVF